MMQTREPRRDLPMHTPEHLVRSWYLLHWCRNYPPKVKARARRRLIERARVFEIRLPNP